VLSEVQCQDEAVAILRRVIEGKYVSPLLLVGEEGTGRRFAVYETIKEMVAADRGGPKAPEVVQIARGVHPDVLYVTAPSEKEIGVEAAREVVDRAQLYPTASPYRFFIVDGADRMTAAAANALLKTLEEPPARSRFFLLAERYDRVLNTIRSRCGRVPFRKLPTPFIISRLSAVEPDGDKALVYGRMGEGSMGRATRYWGASRLTLRDRVLSVLKYGVEGDVSSSFATIDEIVQDLPLALRFLRFLAHDLLVLPLDPDRVFNHDIRGGLAEMRARSSEATWARLSGELKKLEDRYDSSYINLSFHVKTAIVTVFSGVLSDGVSFRCPGRRVFW
jgi:hypothetical protein